MNKIRNQSIIDPGKRSPGQLGSGSNMSVRRFSHDSPNRGVDKGIYNDGIFFHPGSPVGILYADVLVSSENAVNCACRQLDILPP
jgi:hypothetical protein